MEQKNILTALLIGLTVGLAVTLMFNNVKKSESVAPTAPNNNSSIRKISVHKTFNVRRQINDSTTVYTDSTVWYEDED